MDVENIYQELLEMIEQSLLKEEIRNSLNKINQNKELIKKIEKYHQTKDEKIRKEIYQVEDYKHYKQLENRLNKLILQSNLILGVLKNESN